MIIGLDVGGTHADVVLLGSNGPERALKVPTDPSNLFNTVLTGLEKITEGFDPERISRIVLSTTLTTNAVIQKKFSKAGMIVASGPGIDPEFFRTNSQYYPVSGSIDHRGREIDPIDPNEIKEVVSKLKKQEIRYVGVVCKFSVRNPDHELRISRILGDDFEKVFLGHRISGNLNFPRRIATTFFNTSIYPIHKNFFESVKKSLAKKRLTVPIHILKADGGTMSFESSIDFPGQTILSGPAASVMGSIAFAPEDEETLVLDIGGTTTDMAILINRVPLLNPIGIQLGNFKTLIRSLETHSIGLGGDSAVRIENGKLKVGPDRLGHAMAFGGPAPTPTDALCVLGVMEKGDREKSIKGLDTIAKKLGISVQDAAVEIFDLACKKILREARKMINHINSKPVYTVHELLEGYKVKPKRILVLGGPSPYFAKHLEKVSDYKVSVVPGWETANAMGAALARTTCEVTLFADTEQGIATAPEENYSERVNKNFSKEDAVRKAYELLKKKALEKGAGTEELEWEVLENLQFNMVRGFYTTGRNIRTKVQVKPGLIHGFVPVAEWFPSG
jgi:N-methylhydantoinase A